MSSKLRQEHINVILTNPDRYNFIKTVIRRIRYLNSNWKCYRYYQATPFSNATFKLLLFPVTGIHVMSSRGFYIIYDETALTSSEILIAKFLVIE